MIPIILLFIQLEDTIRVRLFLKREWYDRQLSYKDLKVARKGNISEWLQLTFMTYVISRKTTG